MRFQDIAVLTTAFSLGGFAAASGGEESKQAGPDLSQMADRLAELEDNNAALQGRVNELEAADGENWLTKQRAQEIRGVVTDVLADAQTRASLQNSGMNAGWDNGFFLQSPDGRFRLNVGGMVQARWTYSGIREGYSTQTGFNTFKGWKNTDGVGSRKGFGLAHTRLDFNGNIFGQSTRYRVMGEFADTYGRSVMSDSANQPVNISEPEVNSGSYYLLDAWVSHDFTSDFSIRAGQFKLPFDRGWQVPIKYQLIGERDTVSQHLGIGRSQGIELRWSTNDVRIRGAYSDGATDSLLTGYYLVGTRPQNSPWTSQQSNWSVSTRAEFKVAGSWADFARMTSLPGDEFSMLFGLGFHAQENKLYLSQTGFGREPNNNNLWLGFTADATFNFGGASIAASAYYHNIQAKSTVNSSTTIGGGNLPVVSDLGGLNIMGLSLYGSMYVATGFETFLGWEYMDISGGNFSTMADSDEPTGAGAGGTNVAYRSTHPLNLANLGFNWYIDGEDLKLTVMGTYMIAQVYQGFSTPSTGVRGTPVGSSFALRAQLQLLF
jgi:hypothetical protein